MIANVARIVAAVLLGVAAAGSMTITGYLARLDDGIQRDVVAVDKMVEAQRAIQKQNEVLTDMVTATGKIGQGLDQVLTASQQIGGHVDGVGQANRATLELNGILVKNNGAAAKDLERVIAALKGMNQSAAAIDRYLITLRDTAAADVRHLDSISANTARMNAKTPGK